MPPSPKPRSTLRVLLVTPRAEELRAFGSALATDGISITHAPDAAAARAALQHGAFDAAIVSHPLPDADGASACASLRRIPGAPPSILLDEPVDAAKLAALVREIVEGLEEDEELPVGSVLTIVIPALNEEAAIGDTLRRTLEARAFITANSPVRDVDIVVVSDGSTDRTEEIAKSFDDVTVLVFEKNRGYGAAIKCGFEHGRGDLVSFLDADGTCDPNTFAELCRALDEQRADLVLGSRMGPDSEMPLVRTVGNRIFAWILGALSKRIVKDTASGMRVIRRDALESLYPLPDGLHFTPAMSARALLEDKLRLVEVPMPYSERVGRSKLSVVKDGVRFLTVILRAAVAHRPSRPLLLAAGVLGVATLGISFQPVAYWLSHGELREPMIYRVMLASLLGTLSALVVCSALVSEKIAALVHRRPIASKGVTGQLGRLLSRGTRRWSIAALGTAAFVSSWPGMVQYVSTGQVAMHWSRAMLSSLLVVVAVMLGITSFWIHMLELVASQKRDPRALLPPDRIRPGKAAR